MTTVIPIKPPYTPEFLSVAQLAIEGFLADGGDVFEYGSGHSTLWFAGFSDVITVEDNAEWYKEIVSVLDSSGLEADTHYVLPEDIAEVISDYGMFDLILVDCRDDQREQAASVAMSHVKPGGWLVIDDSNWPLWDPAKDLLKTWPYTEMRGPHIRKTGEPRSHETRIYWRPA